MVFTLSDSLRDRDYANYNSIQVGSLTAINVMLASGTTLGIPVSGTALVSQWTGTGSVMISGATPNTIKTYNFTRANCTASAAGLFSAYTSVPINGTLKAIGISFNDYTATGSLFLDYSGASLVFNLWNLISGTETSMVATSGGQMIKAFCRDQNNTSLSGTRNLGIWEDMPLYGVFRLVGSGLGNATTCSGVILAYN